MKKSYTDNSEKKKTVFSGRRFLILFQEVLYEDFGY